MEKLRVGILGAGWAGQTHAKFYRQHPWIEIAGWADIVPGKAAEAAAAFDVPQSAVYLDYREMLEKVKLDAVSVATYNMGHREPTVDVLERGLPVLLEKPMAATLDDAKAIMRAAKETKGFLMVGFQPYFSSEQVAAREIVAAGTLGQIYYGETVAHRRWGIPGGNFVRKASAGAGSLVDIGVYAIHQALTIMNNAEPVSVSAITANHLAKGFEGVQPAFGGSWSAEEFEVEEFAAGFVRFANGASLALKSSWASNVDSMGRTYFLGTKAGLALDPLELYVNQMINRLNFTATPKNLRHVDDWAEKVKVFAEHVRDGKGTPIDPKWAFLVNAIMDGVLRSAEVGHEVKVDTEY
ncbi:MAG TPA: Gfo/Idh/MocA family oxidoreductase [Chloroflexota bacterium]|nr:Gfo/Idh/MocA family oxidoreductase [Chloroflexota bacterium]